MAARKYGSIPTMNRNSGLGQLTNRQYMQLGRAISSPDMESIALGYLQFDEEIIKSLRHENRGNFEAFNRDIIKRWANKNSGSDQVRKLARLLYTAAREYSYVNARKIQEILGIREVDTSLNASVISIDQQKTGTLKYKKITSTEFEAVAEKIRPHTERAFKIEVAPWMKEYVEDTEELYTAVELGKIGEESILLNDYRELFEIENVAKRIVFEPEVQVREGHRNPLVSDDNSNSFRNKIFCCFSRETETKPEIPAKTEMGQRVLLTGDPGMGKTMLCKKITWDWSRKLFTKFSIVFLVFLKLVKSGASIESIIMEQNSFLNSIKVTQSKLKSILETYGSSCLIIFDGFDEHDFGTNTDLVAIVKGEKYPNFNIILTSRHEAVKKVEIHFPLVVRVRGFTRAKAREFVSKILPNMDKAKAVMHFNPVDMKGDLPIYKCPTLLSFLCLLVKEDEIDLTDKTIHTGEIYLRMVRCLYKRSLLRKDRQFEHEGFIKVMVSIGKLAFEMLLSGNPLLDKSEVLEEVGNEAFDYGLFIRHANPHENSDIFVTFADRSIQEFLAAFYFIWMLNEKHTVNSLLGDDPDNIILVTEPLFLKFCLWFLRSKQKHITLRNSSIIYGNLKDFCVRCIKSMQLDVAEIADTYPALDPTAADASKDELHMKFIAHIFKNCSRRKCIVM